MLCGPASAHTGDLIGGIDVVGPVGGALPTAIETNYGLILQQGDTYAWVCHEAVTTPGAVRSPRYHRSTDGVWLATVSDPEEGRGGRTLFRSTDGCTWEDVDGLSPGVLVSQAIFAPTDPSRAWATTAIPGGPNGVLSSSDGGQSWSWDLPEQPGQGFHSVAIHADTVWATSTDPGGARGSLWRRATEGGWQEQPVELPKGTEAARLVLVALDTGAIWLQVDPIGADTLLHSTDDGVTFSSIPLGGNLSDADLHDHTLWIIRDGRELLPVVEGALGAPAPGFSPSTGLYIDAAGMWLPEQSYITGPLLSRSDDQGQTFEPLAYPDDISAPLDCPANTQVAEICAPLWGELVPRIRGFDSPEVDTAADTGLQPPPPNTDGPAGDGAPGCGCHSGVAGGWGLIGIAALARRRRRRRRPS